MATSTHTAGPFVHVSVPSAILDITISDLECRRGVEGPQIIMTWTKPTKHSELSKIRIVRKMGSYPANETDGKIVLDSTDTTVEAYTDFPGLAPEYFYYKFFHQWGSMWVSHPLTECVELAHDTQVEVQDKFFKELPELYRAWDKERYGSGQLQLSPADLDAFEKILLAEDGVTDQGELRRFLKLFNIFFNEVLALNRAIATRDGLAVVHDVQRTKPQYLDYIARQYGWRFNFDLPVDAARQEVMDLPDTYRKKGRTDVTTDFINGILTGHTAEIIIFDQVLDWNGYPDSSILDTTDIVGEVDFLTKDNTIHVITDLGEGSTIGFNQVAIYITPGAANILRASSIKKLENITTDFFSILDNVFIVIHQIFNLTYPTDFTNAGVTTINAILLTGGTRLDPFQWFEIGKGDDSWDYGLTPTEDALDTALVDPEFRDVPRNVVYADASWDPTTTPGKKVLVRCFEDVNTFSSQYIREMGLFYGGSSTIGSGTLLAEKFFPLRFADAQVRYITDFRIQFP